MRLFSGQPDGQFFQHQIFVHFLVFLALQHVDNALDKLQLAELLVDQPLASVDILGQ